MRVAGLNFESRRLEVCRLDFAERELGATEVRWRVHEVGVCGTDRDLARFRLGAPPPGESFLVLGHEALGQVEAVGREVVSLRPGDWVGASVRRACRPACAQCAAGRRDLCLTGAYRERGIWKEHGYFCEWAVDEAADLWRAPESIVDVAVLLEPLSVVEKAIDLGIRLHVEGQVESALVLGAGPVGLLASLALALRGCRVTIASLEPDDHPRARLARGTGAEYQVFPPRGEFDLAIEAAGSPEAARAGAASLGPLGVLIVLGARHAGPDFPLMPLILKNQVVAGSVNASPAGFAQALEDLPRMPRAVLEGMLHRFGFDEIGASIVADPPPAVDAPKLVHRLAD